MNQKINYQKELDNIILNLAQDGEVSQKPTLLLHACCGPCSSYVIEYLSNFFDITILYYNPNIYPENEYFRRLEELKSLLPRFPAAFQNNVKLITMDYNPDDFYKAIDIKNHPELAVEPEKGERCYKCYEFRLKQAYKYASEHNFEWFCTTLSISPFKDAEKINTIGNLLEKQNSVNQNFPKWLTSDFKKKGGFKRSLEFSQEYDLYRQQYCGCVYSKTNTEASRKQTNSISN